MSKQELDELLKQYHFQNDPLSMSEDDVVAWRDILQTMLKQLLILIKENNESFNLKDNKHKPLDLNKVNIYKLYKGALIELDLVVDNDKEEKSQIESLDNDSNIGSKLSTLNESITDIDENIPNLGSIYTRISLTPEQAINPIGKRPTPSDHDIRDAIYMQNIAQLTILKLILVMMTMSNRYLNYSATSNFNNWSNIDWCRFILITIVKTYQCNWQRKSARNFRAMYNGVVHQDVQSIELVRNNTIIKKVLVVDIVKYQDNEILKGHGPSPKKRYESSIFLEVASGYVAKLFDVKLEKAFGNNSIETLLISSELIFSKEFWLYQDLMIATKLLNNYQHLSAQSLLTKRIVKAYWKKDPNRNKSIEDTKMYLNEYSTRITGRNNQKTPIGRCYFTAQLLNLNEIEITNTAIILIAKGRLQKPKVFPHRSISNRFKSKKKPNLKTKKKSKENDKTESGMLDVD
jgi:hypothetical protein